MLLLYITSSAEFFFIFLFTIILLYKYAHKETGCTVKFLTLLGWNLGFAMIAILPIDIYIVRRFLSINLEIV